MKDRAKTRPKKADTGEKRPAATETVRLQKFLARAGLGSRRGCEKLITEARVTVDGKTVTELGTSVDPSRHKIAVDGQLLREQRPVYLALHKPTGTVCSNRRQGRSPCILDLVPSSRERLFCIGRLDKESAGLLLVTNDGDLCHYVSHPSHEVPKTYRVVVKGQPEAEGLEKLREGMWLAEGRTAPATIKITRRTRERTTLLITLREGKNRHIRRILARVGLRVRTLTRVRIGPVSLRRLSAGAWRRLTQQELDGLRSVPREESTRGRTTRGPVRRPSSRKPSRSEAGSTRARSRNSGAKRPARAPAKGKTGRKTHPPGKVSKVRKKAPPKTGRGRPRRSGK